MEAPTYHSVMKLKRTNRAGKFPGDIERDAVVLAVARTIDNLTPLLSKAEAAIMRELAASEALDATAYAVATGEASWRAAGGPDAVIASRVLNSRLTLVRCLLGKLPPEALNDEIVSFEGLLRVLAYAATA